MNNAKKIYALLLLLSTVFLYPCEKMQHDESNQIDNMVQIVRDTIDEQMLGISRNAFCRSIRGSLWSFIRCSRLYRMQMIAELQKIESYIPHYEGNRELLFKKLIACHAYFYWLMDCMVESNLKMLDLVSGSCIDAFNKSLNKHFEGLSPELSTFIVDHTKRRYAGLYSQITKKFQDIPFSADFDIHHMPLRSDHVIEKIDFSCDGKYVLAHGSEQTTIWMIRNGEKQDCCLLNTVRLQNNTDPHLCENDDCWVVNGKDLLFKKTWNSAGLAIAYGLSSEQGGRIVSLFKRPTYESLLCQNALRQSCGSSSNLQALNGSDIVKNLPEGFPKLQLQKAISAQLKKLE